MLVHSAAVVLAENSEVGVKFQCTPAKPLVDVFLYSGGAELTAFSCGKHKHTQTYCELIGSGGADTHTDRLSHFSFFLFYPLP